ncbi:MAG: zinc ribbon domain-containing protein, partial [bacterium]|nr:zinc ribbon domain-containing protein [bacterium]
HNYILNGGLLYCKKCGSLMEGRSGTGSKGVRYYYYACKQKAYGFRISSDEVEQKVLEHIKNLATLEDTLAKLVDDANRILQNDYPRMIEQREVLSKEISEINDLADGLLSNLSGFGSDDGSSFVKKKLDDLGKRQKGLEKCLLEVDGMITRLEKDLVDHEAILSALKQFNSVYDSLKPYQQRSMIKLVIHKVVVGDDNIHIALYGKLSGNALENVLTNDDVRSERINWLLE